MSKTKDKQIDKLNEWDMALAMLDQTIEDTDLTIKYIKNL